MAFFEARLLDILRQLPTPAGYLVAFSGGVDSTVLLHGLAGLRKQLGIPVHAIHADHGLQADSPRWTEHCRRECQVLAVPLREVSLELVPAKGQSLEADARQARYLAFAEQLAAGEMLLTAHHGDDQAETLLLQLFRGAGVAGLAAMPRCTQWNEGWLARPLLDFSRADIESYATEAGLSWVEDSSNRDLSFERNYLRRRIFPQLKERWPGVVKTLGRSAGHCAQAATLMDEIAAADLPVCRGSSDYRVTISQLLGLSLPRQENLLRYWIRIHNLPVPPTDRITRILGEVVQAREGGDPVVAWENARVRRFAGELALMPHLPEPEPEFQSDWEAGDTVHLPAGLGCLVKSSGQGGISAERWRRAEVRVGFRQAGLNCTPSGRQGSRTFKRVCQDLRIPPWLRDRLPLVFLDDELAAIGDYCVCEPFAARDEEPSVVLSWNRDEYLK